MELYIQKQIQEAHINPQLARKGYCLLDGVWNCNGHAIRVPYPPEADLAEYGARAELFREGWDGRLTYQTRFTLPADFSLPRVRLHFGAVDQICEVYVNGEKVGRHEGGYLAFAFDITEQLKEQGVWRADNELRVEVTDTLSHAYPYGKQRHDRGGMWYTPVSGIWKSVWLENVAEVYVAEWSVRTDLAGADFSVVMSTGEVCRKRLEPENPQLWTPEHPYLYGCHVKAGEDEFDTYFALRTVEIREVDGIQRVCLNNVPVFLHGVLDQGYWQDGIYAPASPENYRDDILNMKELGFNLLRKHCKVEAAYFYFLCDKLGMLVCQDMVNSGRYHYWLDTIFPTLMMKRKKDTRYRTGLGVAVDRRSQWKDAYDDDFRREFFIRHCKETLAELQNHPCVIMYTIFNEGWGQFDSDKAYEELKACDGSRLYDSTSGWFAQKQSDFDTEHVYFWKRRLKPKMRPMFLKECGGFSLPLAGHMWNEKKTYGYGACKSKEKLTDRICDLYGTMVIPAIAKGLCGCIYTQLSDVEDEINGMYTYDRAVCKVDKARMQEIAEHIRQEMERGAGK